MSHVRHVLQSVELYAITNARASDDYHPGNGQWNIGTSSILAYAVGIAPSKDNYWYCLRNSEEQRLTLQEHAPPGWHALRPSHSRAVPAVYLISS